MHALPVKASRAKTIYHVKVLVLVQIVDLEQVLRFQTVILAALEEQFHVLPLEKNQSKAKNKNQNITTQTSYINYLYL